MKFWIKTMLVVSILSLSACTDDEGVSPLKRDTDAVELTYNTNSTTRVSVRYSGAWSARVACVDASGERVDDNWFAISPAEGVGNGSDYQWITITAQRNAGAKRSGYLYIKPVGGEELKIAVSQGDGVFSVKDPKIVGTLRSGSASAATLDIEYDKAFGGEVISVATTLSGSSEGLSIKDVFETTIEREGTGVISIPITGVPTSLGALDCQVVFKMDGVEKFNGKITGSVSSSNEVFRQGFDLFVWGGRYIENKPGGSPTGKQAGKDFVGTEEVPEQYKESVSAGTDGASDAFGTMTEDYRRNRNIVGWTGQRVYEHPGYIKLGVTANGGWIMTPPLEALNSTPQTVVVSIDFCRFDNNDGTHILSAEGAGHVVNGRIDAALLPAPAKASERKWTTLTFTVKEATNKTQLKLSAESTTETKEAYRLNIDNFIVMGASKIPISKPLDKPNVETIRVNATQSSFDIAWDAVKNADAYDVELIDVTRPQFSFKQRVLTTDIQIADITPGYYDLKLTAVWADDEKLNSETATKSIATKDVRTDPLDTPTGLAYTNNGYTLTATWAAVTDATGYTAALYDGAALVKSSDVADLSCAFDNLEGGEKSYTLKVTATFRPNPKLNSPAATKAVKTLPFMTAPALSILVKSHGYAVVEWVLSSAALAEQALANGDTYDLRVKNAAGQVIRSFDGFSRFNFTKYNNLRLVWGGLSAGTQYKFEMRRKAASATLSSYVDSDWGAVTVTTDAAPSTAGYLLYKDFQNFPVGAMPLYGAYGFSMGATADFSDPDAIVLATGDANHIYTQGVKYGVASFFDAYLREWDMAEWGPKSEITNTVQFNMGIGAGYMKFGGGGNPAWVTLPAFPSLTTATDLYLELDTCPYIEPSAAGDMMAPSNTDVLEYFYVAVAGGGVIAEVTGETSANAVIEAGGSKVKLQNVLVAKMVAEGLTDRYRFTSHKVKITGATAATRIKIYTSDVKSGSTNFRMWMSNVKVKRAN